MKELILNDNEYNLFMELIPKHLRFTNVELKENGIDNLVMMDKTIVRKKIPNSVKHGTL